MKVENIMFVQKALNTLGSFKSSFTEVTYGQLNEQTLCGAHTVFLPVLDSDIKAKACIEINDKFIRTNVQVCVGKLQIQCIGDRYIVTALYYTNNPARTAL